MAEKIILITGASRGIGAATARLAGKAGFAVCVNFHTNEAAAQRVVKEIEKSGGNAIAVQADISEQQQVVRLFETVDAELGRLDALVNNAGILAQQMRVETMQADRLNRIFATNITGCFFCAREAIKRMSTKHGGSGGAIVNVSSAASRYGSPNEYVDYAASKGAIDTMTIGLAQEVAAEGIRVNAVRPGIVHTEIHASGGHPKRATDLSGRIPLKRAGEPEEIARAILWLISEKASYCTGAILDVTGGK